MRIPRRIFLALAFSAGVLALGAQEAATLPAGVRRVLFLGDSITYAVQIETYFLLRHPERRVEFINTGLSSETVSGLSEPGHAGGEFPRPDLHERLDRVLTQVQPDFVLACYGMNDGIYLPFDPARFQAYQDGLQRLRRAVLARGATLLHVTPPVHVDVKGTSPTYAAVLDRYAAWLIERRAEGWAVADAHAPMVRALAEGRRANPAFTFARDGVHPDESGHWVMARAILRELGARDLPDDGTAAAMASAHPHGTAIMKLAGTRMALLRDAWLSATGHLRPKVKPGLPLADAHRRAGEIEAEIRALLSPAPASR
jgi:lysophospholipase L1-like esterase